MGNNVSKKFGSRILSDEEVRLTLPTYDKLLEQIEDMRDDDWDEDKSKNLHNQKINNISILGARGTGKTSILKSLINKLEEENIEENKCKKDIILGKNVVLPMIVPENMSTSSNLMSMILGLFKGIVDKLEKKYDNKTRDCWFEKKSDISTQYLELVKKFCFIQPDFKSVPIKQYTTENDYVEKSSQIYQSDIEFMACFNEFINKLMTIKEGEEEKEEKNKRLIFVFIDDMDLSTQRCVDAVRTLLAYISHPRIVTILAGDLETFEEALTLDFIRQEQMVRADIFETKFVVANTEKDEYLERKKDLTYEYLKKVMPVVYRHNLREWSLETRGNYIVRGNDGNEKNLVELLNDCFIYLKKPLIFQYFDKENSRGENIPQMFHIFDNTARGLNAVYNILLDTNIIMPKEEEDKRFPQIKILLETIVGSNSLFNQYRKQIFEEIVKFGVNFEDTRIDCENFKSFIIKEFKSNSTNVGSSSDINSLNVLLKDIKSTNTIKIFSFFVFLDFSMRVLKQDELLYDKTYLELKQYNLINLMNNSAISGSMSSYKNIIELDNKEGIICTINYEYEEAKGLSNLIISILFKIDFNIAITLFYLLSKKKFNFFDDGKGRNINWNWIYELCMSLYYMIRTIGIIRLKKYKKIDLNVEIEKVVAIFTRNYEGEFRSLLEIIGGGNPTSQMLKVLIYGIANDFGSEKPLFWNEKEYRAIMLNTLSDTLENRIFDKNFLKSISERKEEYNKLFVNDEDMRNRLSIIYSIDENNLWKNEFSVTVRKYVIKVLKSLINYLKFEENEMVDVSCIKQEWADFKNSYKGVSKTMAIELSAYIQKLFNENGECKVKLSEIIDLFTNIRELAYSNAWYGRDYAFAMLKKLENARLERIDANKKEGTDTSVLEQLYVFIHIYASYTLAENKDLYSLSTDVSEFINVIYDGSIEGVNKKIESYKAILTKDVGEEVVSKFEELFPSKGEKDVK